MDGDPDIDSVGSNKDALPFGQALQPQQFLVFRVPSMIGVVEQRLVAKKRVNNLSGYALVTKNISIFTLCKHLLHILNHCLDKSICRVIGGSDVYHIEGSVLRNGTGWHVIAGDVFGVDSKFCGDGFNG